jgi:hypothetical protein
MIAITIISSISVKPSSLRRLRRISLINNSSTC